ncbi:uncharacterized protein FOMMEDRAFT_32408 [Fomitiporia mediterranea MF3/22]|uniref:Uncharacterized protein n=1 Tax=Fomitiporia mediterranea (strain MF3/22) TaxID=694068 RepID=R7SH61_FOMME|nr:uncharacterized protein FOMMEDRAFT_32408 [Fomitiporia mediterranea MF3/22]EJC97637.1 hypothetical protein FOMMEDRAFT_32408 [Fomitiporia mediterranea MF3/22]
MVTDVQVAGPSRAPTSRSNRRPSTSPDHRRRPDNINKAGRIGGAPASASFLRLDTDAPAVLQAFSRGAADLQVAPLNFNRRHRRKSQSMTRIETEMTDYKRDAARTFDASVMHVPQAHYLQGSIEPCITRRQSLPDTSLSSEAGDGSLKRLPRPLPPVPREVSRPGSPASSISSFSSASCPRPLPTPPNQSPANAISPITFTPATPLTSPDDTFPVLSTPPRTTKKLLVPPCSPPETDPANAAPLSPLSIITDLSNISRATSGVSPRSPRGTGPAARKRHQIHASPYKLARNPTRFSTTSLSSQISVPPVPPAAELRRRNRDKMAKLIRVLGESPPTELVFPTEYDDRTSSDFGKGKRGGRGRRGGRESTDTIKEEPAEFHVPKVLEPLRRSLSLNDSSSSVFGKMKKSLSDPDAGHGVRVQSPTAPTSTTTSSRLNLNPPSSFLRLRTKKGRADIDKAPRYVVSLFGTAESGAASTTTTSDGTGTGTGTGTERLTFKLNAATPKMKPTGSYLRGAYKTDAKPVEVKLPPLPLPTMNPSLDSLGSKHWIRETGESRWEVDDYENVVMSLRKL